MATLNTFILLTGTWKSTIQKKLTFAFSWQQWLRERESMLRHRTLPILRSVLFWNITQNRVVIPYRRFRTTYRSCLQRSRVKKSKKTSWLLKMGPIGCRETSVRNYHSTLCNRSRVKKSKNTSWQSWPLKMGPIGCPETSVSNYHSTLRNIPEECRFHLHRGEIQSCYNWDGVCLLRGTDWIFI